MHGVTRKEALWGSFKLEMLDNKQEWTGRNETLSVLNTGVDPKRVAEAMAEDMSMQMFKHRQGVRVKDASVILTHEGLRSAFMDLVRRGHEKMVASIDMRGMGPQTYVLTHSEIREQDDGVLRLYSDQGFFTIGHGGVLSLCFLWTEEEKCTS